MQTVSISEISYAGFWRRLLALFLDITLFTVLSSPVMYLLIGHSYFYWLVDNELQLENISNIPFLIYKSMFFVVLFGFWTQMSTTPGKLLTGCRIVDAKSLLPISIKQALIRLVGYFISGLPLYIGFVWAAFDRKKQGLHDKLARTIVIYQSDDYAHKSIAQLEEEFLS